MPPFPLNSGFLSIREIERDQYLCITNNHPVSERIKTTESPCQSPRYSSGISQNQYIEMGKRFYLARALLCYNSVYTSLALLLDWYVSH